MKKLFCLLPCTYCLLLFAGQKPQPAEDLCAAPPSNAAPTLPAHLVEGHGKINMPITTRSGETQEFFNQGVGMMHSFWSREAERSFLQAAQLDPEAPMAYWGIAMVAAGDYRPAFQLRDDGRKAAERPAQASVNPPLPAGFKTGIQRAREAAVKAQQLSSRASRREQLYIAAIVARRNPDAKDPDGDYVRALRDIVREFPEEVEAKSYLALALMSGYTPGDKKPRPGTEEAVAILTELVKQHPEHPGINHYIIHGLEGSTHAQDAWPSCARYPQLAPANPHAQHMPGHIYAQSGRFSDAAAAFETAARLERQELAADQLYPNGHHGHNVHFLTTTYSFMGKYDEAMKNSEELLQIRENPREAKQLTNNYTVYRQGWHARMRTLIRFERWDDILGDKALPDYPAPFQHAWRAWARGLAYTAKGQIAQARAELKSMDAAMKEWQKLAGSESPHLRAARLELLGHIEVHSGRKAKGLDTLERAANSEILLPYNEPPIYPRSVWEALGKEALDLREWTRAESAFRHALEQYPGSPYAKDGLSAALAHSEKTLAARAGL
ncbi:MAG: hypothetical protein HY236_10235 [Acidobacteria bacterium]|nr:hypothetical protein [Acidobacteriota bacterium]